MTLTRAVLAFLLCMGSSAAVAADLDAVQANLLALRGRTDAPGQAMPREFLAARDALGALIERRLSDLPTSGDINAFVKKLNTDVAAAGLTCRDPAPPGYDRCASPGMIDARGYVGLFDAAVIHGFLIVQAEIGVTCGFDETAYFFEPTKTGWRRLFDTSQKPDAAGRYIPEQVQVVSFARSTKLSDDSVVFLVSGAQPTCGEKFRPVHYRVWNARVGKGAELLVDGRELNAFTGRRDPPVSVRFDGNDLLVEMDVGSIDPERFARVAVRRLEFDSKGIRRIPPIALTPRDFVEEWLRAPWSTSSVWTRADVRKSLETIHARANETSSPARFSGVTQRCEKEEGVVQVGVRFSSGEMFFRIKNDPTGAYEMLAADSAASPACAKPDATLDRNLTLF